MQIFAPKTLGTNVCCLLLVLVLRLDSRNAREEALEHDLDGYTWNVQRFFCATCNDVGKTRCTLHKNPLHKNVPKNNRLMQCEMKILCQPKSKNILFMIVCSWLIVCSYLVGWSQGATDYSRLALLQAKLPLLSQFSSVSLPLFLISISSIAPSLNWHYSFNKAPLHSLFFLISI